MTQVRVPFTIFGKTKLVPRTVVTGGGHAVPDPENGWDNTLFAERSEDYYALSSSEWRKKRTLVVSREDWLNSEEVTP